jgi:hypothetical protein
MPSTSYLPGFLNGTSATYRVLAASGSALVVSLRNGDLTASDW